VYIVLYQAVAYSKYSVGDEGHNSQEQDTLMSSRLK
jgi:hypothetical protein